MDERERHARAFVQRVQRNQPWLLSEEGNEQFYHAQMAVEDIEVLVELARMGEKKALEIVRAHAEHLHQEALRTGRVSVEVPTSLHELALEVFIYGPPKGKSGPKPTRNSLRRTTIALLVKWVCKVFRFPIFANVEHRGNPDAPMTALRLVGEELGLSERTVEEIWIERKEMATRPRWSR